MAAPAAPRRQAILRLLRRRLLQAVPLLLGVIIINFLLIQASPGTFLDVITSDSQISDPAMIAHLRQVYGLDQPAWMQLLKYIWSILHLDFGFSYRQNMPVMEAINDALPGTVLLMLSALLISVLLGGLAGVVAAVKVGTIWDALISLAALVFFAAPGFWLGIMLVILFGVKLGWFPVGGMETIGYAENGWQQAWDIARHLVLPALSLGLFYMAIYARVMRASMLEVARADFVRTARAKGLSPLRVTLAHTLRNALLPVVTLIGLQMGTVLAGSVTIETVFSWPGIGSLLFDSVSSRNYPVVLGVLVLGSVVVILANIVVDVVYMLLDPRIQMR